MTKKAIRVDQELSEILDLVHFAVQLRVPLTNNEIQNFLILSLCQDGKSTASCFGLGQQFEELLDSRISESFIGQEINCLLVE